MVPYEDMDKKNDIDMAIYMAFYIDYNYKNIKDRYQNILHHMVIVYNPETLHCILNTYNLLIKI